VSGVAGEEFFAALRVRGFVVWENVGGSGAVRRTSVELAD